MLDQNLHASPAVVESTTEEFLSSALGGSLALELGPWHSEWPILFADEKEMPFSRLYVRGAAERGQLPEGFSGSWVGAFKGESIELRLGSVEKGFAGLIKMGDGEGFLPVSSLIQRQVVGDRIKFVAFVAFSGEISFELGLEGKALQGQVSECPSVRVSASGLLLDEGWRGGFFSTIP